VLQQELHNAAMRPLQRLEDKQHCGAISGSYLWTTPKQSSTLLLLVSMLISMLISVSAILPVKRYSPRRARRCFCIQLILRGLRALRGKSLLKCRQSIGALRIAIPVLISLSLAACQNNLEAGAPALNASSIQVIIKPNPGVNLSRGAASEFFKGYQAEIVYLRKMSGQSHVVRIDSVNADAFQATLEQLNKDPRIEYAEPDLIMKIQ
jgi:hypothetical protein